MFSNSSKLYFKNQESLLGNVIVTTAIQSDAERILQKAEP